AKRELQEERDRVRALTNEKENALEASINQLQEMKKELAEAWSAVASAESRAAVAEARCSEFETKMKSTEQKVDVVKGDSRYDRTVFSTNEVSGELWKITEELEKVKEEAKANKDYMVQAERVKKALEGEVSSLRDRVSELEKQYVRLFFSLFVFLLPRLRSLFFFFFSLFFFLPPSAVTAQNQSAMVEIDRFLMFYWVFIVNFDTFLWFQEMLKTSWEKEKVTLQAMKDEAERKSNELNEQAETEKTLLKQENSRLQAQVC
ncbi:hypothetical protein BHE74_00022888, partial [Ensete ventricosum]